MDGRGRIHHDPLYVAPACAVTPVAATTVLWCAFRLHGLGAVSVASVRVAVAATSTHHPGMTDADDVWRPRRRVGPRRENRWRGRDGRF